MTDLFDNPVPALVERKTRKNAPGQQLQICPEIKSISFDQDELLQNILTLYVAGSTFDVDATYGYGEFYKRIPRPKLCFDIDPKKPEATLGDSRNLPIPSSSIKSLMFDPPFVVSNHVTSENYVMSEKYGGYKTITELRNHYKTSLDEFSRVLRPRGILVFKCQDFVHGRSNYFIHNEIYEMAKASGFKGVDLYILFARNRFRGGVNEQNHARKFHSYFWIFRKMQKQRKKSGSEVSD
ncbi:class I SAM-dependent methyltransferase [Spirosoma areae]